jgi:UDP-N-acetylmuramoyl-tripeptide--D-alanyl-D-alanine ligase
VQPQVALITNAGPVHLEGFGDINGVARGKGEIFQGLSEQGVAVLNADDEHYSYWRELIGNKKFISFGFNPRAEVRAHSVTNDDQGYQTFVLSTPQGEATIRLAFIGQHNISNALGAAAASLALGAKLAHIQTGLQQVLPVTKRLNKRIGLQGAMVIDDTYNANPNAFRAALESIQQYTGEKILVAGDMAELGESAEHYHTELGKLARKMGIQQLFAQGKFSRFTVASFGAGGQHFNDKETLANALLKNLNSQSVVLVKGSRSAKMEEVVNKLINEE